MNPQSAIRNPQYGAPACVPMQLTLDKDQAAQALGVPVDTVLNLTRTGQLTSIMVGKHRRWVLEDLKVFVDAKRTGPALVRKVS